MKKAQHDKQQGKKTERFRNPALAVIRIFICIAVAGITLLAYIERQNDLTGLRLAIPALAKEVKATQEDIIRLTYEIEHFNNPAHLTELAKKPDYSHLRFPYTNEEVFLTKMPPLPKVESAALSHSEE